jgi:hypothetical protein
MLHLVNAGLGAVDAQPLPLAYLTTILSIIFLLDSAQYLDEHGRGLIASHDRLAPSTAKNEDGKTF